MIIPARFNGPTTSGNGGWVAGALTDRLRAEGIDGAVQVQLLGPPPLDVDLDLVVADGTAELRRGDDVLARAAAADPLGDPPAPVDRADADAGRRRFLEFPGHPFTRCFVCGTERDDGLHLFPGPVVAGDWSHVAAPFMTREFADAPELLPAVLDCPGGWTAGLAEAGVLLAGYTVQLSDRPEAGEPCVVVGVADGPRGSSGRARAARSAAFGADGRLLGQAEAVWIAPRT